MVLFFSEEEATLLKLLADFNTTDTAGTMYQSILHNSRLSPRVNPGQLLENLSNKGVIKLTDRMVFFTQKGYMIVDPSYSNQEGGRQMLLSTEQKKAARFRFLETLYKETNGSEQALVSMFDIGEKSGLNREISSDVFDYLRGEGLVEAVALGGIIKITHLGVVEYEGAVGDPETPTHYFPAVNVINNILSITGTVSGSQIQQGAISSQQKRQSQDTALAEIPKWIDDLAEKLDAIGLMVEQQRIIREEIETVRALLATSNPKRTFLRESLTTIRSVLEGVAGNAIAAVLLSQIPGL